MKKNGFTLVELLAVIAILAILVAIIMPNVVKEYNKAKANIFVTDVQSFMNAATSKFTGDALSHAGETIYYSSKPNSDLNTSKLNMDSDKEYFIEMDRHGNIKRLVLYDKTFCYDVYTTYGDNSIGIIDGTNSKENNGESIKKDSININDIWDSGETDSVEINVTMNNGKVESYFVKGCDAIKHSIEDNSNDQIVQDNEPGPMSLYTVMKNEAEDSILAKKYNGVHKDSFTSEGKYDIYHYYANSDSEANTILNKNNVLFANHCWQMIRTTDTGGVKLLYNGEADNEGKCGTNRTSHIGYSGDTSSVVFDSSYYFGSNYVYDNSTGKFRLDGTLELKEYTESTADSLIGKYTCKLSTVDATCSTLYLITNRKGEINKYNGKMYLYVVNVKPNINYSSIGYLRYNIGGGATNAGYIQGKEYYGKRFSTSYLSHYYGSSITWDGNKYTLVDPITFTNSNKLTQVKTHHYTCSNPNETSCETVFYIYNNHWEFGFKYVILEKGDLSFDDVLNKSLRANNVDSTLKFGLEKWFQNNMMAYTSYLDDVIYCNVRDIKDYEESGFNPNGGAINSSIKFKNLDGLKCNSVYDQLSISNNIAKLKYSIAIPTYEELSLLNNNLLRKTGISYWTSSHSTISDDSVYTSLVDSSGNFSSEVANVAKYVRPMITLKSTINYVSGDGSIDNPYVIE